MSDRHDAQSTSAATMSIGDLADRARALLDDHGPRVIIGICGSPGAGKSTVAESLASELGRSMAVVVPMDGFHLASSVIRDTPLAARRGALDTFDLASYRVLIERMRSREDDIVFAPDFSRQIEEPIASAIPVARQTPIVVTEGNYLLADHPQLARVRSLIDEVWFLDTPEPVRLPRLVARHIAFGKLPDDAARWATGSDQRNAESIESTRQAADLVVTLRA